MSLLRIDREHVSFNEGGHHFTFYLRWTPRGICRRMFRVWAKLGAPRGYELCFIEKIKGTM